MYRMYGMTRCQGWQGAAHVQDVRADICSLQSLHFHQSLPTSLSHATLVNPVHRPWWSYDSVPGMVRNYECREVSDVFVLLVGSNLRKVFIGVHSM